MDSAPLLWPSVDTPAKEVAAIKDLYAHLVGLKYSVEAWEAALLLYQIAQRPPTSISRAVASRWRFVAAVCGAMFTKRVWPNLSFNRTPDGAA